MTKGVLGIIICPMNDDHLLHYLYNDRDIGRIVLLKNKNSGIMAEKLTKHGVVFDSLPEEDFDSGKIEFDRNIFNIVIKANTLGLHAEPKKLREHIERQIVEIQPLVDALGLYYGMCGNYGWDPAQWANSMGYKPTEILRGNDGLVCDDCVSIALGSSSKYLDLERKHAGKFFLTPSIADNWDMFIGSSDSAKDLARMPQEFLEEYDIKTPTDYMRWLFELGGYQHILKLDTGIGDTERFDEEAEEIGKKLKLIPISENGWTSLDASDNIYNKCKEYLKR